MAGAKAPNERDVLVFYMIYSLLFLPEKCFALGVFDTWKCFIGSLIG